MKKPVVIGVTGTIGSGKSTVGAILEKHGVPVVDSDRVVHDLFDSDDALKTAIRNRFGDKVLVGSAGSEKVDRAILGQIVFADALARKDLEAIVHPATIAACQKTVDELSANEIVAVLVPLLFEAGLEKHYDEIWTVYANAETLKKRLQSRDNLSIEDVERRLAAQLPQEEKMSRALQTIDNSGTAAETERQVIMLLDKLRKQNHYHNNDDGGD